MTSLQIIQSISIILASWSVLYGIDAWRREHRGKRQIELAEETLALFYEAADAIRNIRCSLSFSSETDHVQRNEKENDAQFEARKRACIVFSRYEEYRELFSKIHSMRYRFMAQERKKKAEPFNELRNITNSILNSAHALARLWAREHFRSDEDREKHEEHIAEYEAYFWEQHGDKMIP